MRYNWKYFLMRSIHTLVILMIVILVISAFLGITYQREKVVGSREFVGVRSEKNYEKLSNMSVEEREDWAKKKAEEFRVGDYPRRYFPGWIRNKEVYSRSLWTESFDQALKVVRLDFGESRHVSVRKGEDLSEVTRDVVDVILKFLPRTVMLFSTAIAICLPLSIYIGVKVAISENKIWGKVLSFLNIVGSSMPIWWGAYIGLLIFAFYLRWIDFSPLPFPRTEGLDYYYGVFKKMLFPLTVIILIKLNHTAWTTRNLVTSEMQKEYVVGQKAKGLSEKMIAKKHALKNSAPPIISKSTQFIIYSIPELVIFESIIGWPGVGFLFYRALNLGGTDTVAVDVNLVAGLAFFLALLTVTLQWIADIMYGVADPRIRVGEE